VSDPLTLDLNEEEFHFVGLMVGKKLTDGERAVVRRLQLDRNTLLVRMKIIAEALESKSPDTNPIEEVAKWAREAYEEVVLQ
jgi:hypothetical protein